MPILSQLDQNLTYADAKLALKSWLTFPSRNSKKLTQNSKYLEKYDNIQRQFKTELEAYFNPPEAEKTTKVTFFDSGRTSLEAGLLALKQIAKDPSRNQVLISAYTCAVVVNSILRAGLKPVFVDIQKSNLKLKQTNLQSKLTAQTLALIVQNTFGATDNYQELKQFAENNKIYLIEDLAHSFGATYQDQPVGILSDFAFLSFGSGKIISSSRGGAVLTANRKIYKEVTKFKNSIPEMPHTEVKRHLYKIFTFYFFSRFYFALGKQFIALLSKIYPFPQIMTPAEKKIDISKISVYKYPPQLSEIALNQFRNLQANLEHRKQIAQIYQEELSKEPKIKLFSFDSLPLLGFPILLDRPRKLHKNLLKRRIQLNLEWSKTNILPADINHKRTQYIPNSSKNSESVAKKLIYLPTHIHITPKKAYKVCRQIINEL